jgi:uncharacterized protein (UPF0335 family)
MSDIIDKLNDLMEEVASDTSNQRLRIIGLVRRLDERDLDAIETILETYVRAREE